MPFTHDLPDRAGSKLAEQLGRGLPDLKGAVTSSVTVTVELTESFPVWSLSADDVRSRRSDDLADLAVDTGQWHHQISRDGEPALYARSRSADNPDDWELSQVFDSPLAKKFDAAIKWIDAHEKRDLFVRVLEAPSYHLHGFWLEGRNDGSFVLVVDAARRRLAEFARPEPYTSKAFLDELRRVDPIKGVVLDTTR